MPVSGQPQGRAGSSTIVQPSAGQAAGAQVSPVLGKTQQLARSLIAVRKQFFTAKDLADPQRLYQVLYQMQQGTTTALHALGSNPMSAGVMLAGVVFTAGQTQYLSHGLGRAYTGWLEARVQGSASSSAYGSLYDIPADGASAALTTTAFVQIPLQRSGPSSGTTLTTGATGHVKVTSGGTYQISASLSINPGAQSFLTVSAFVNGVQISDVQALINATNGTEYPISMGNIHTLSAGDTVDIRMKQASMATNTVVVDAAQLVITSVGGGGGLTEAALPSGVTSDKQIGLTAGAAGTYSVWVF